MTILQTISYPIPVVIENITATTHINYYAHITLFYPIITKLVIILNGHL